MNFSAWLKLGRMPEGFPSRLLPSDETKARVLAGLLWLAVIVGAAGGATSLAIGHRVQEPARRNASPASAMASASVAAAGFGERFVAAYLRAQAGAEVELASFLGYAPELPPAEGPVPSAGSVRAVGVELVDEGYWAVTVTAGESGGETFWRIGVLARRGGRLVAVGLPTPVAGPVAGDAPEWAVGLASVPPAGDPLAETVAGWVAAYACGRGDASRYLAPGVALGAVTPPLCRESRMERWGASDPDGRGRVTVVAEAVLSGRGVERRVSFALRLARRGGRWEIAELLGAPPLAPDDGDRSSDREVTGL